MKVQYNFVYSMHVGNTRYLKVASGSYNKAYQAFNKFTDPLHDF